MMVNTLSRQTLARQSAPYPFLVIGYDNELRGDDAVSAKVAETIASWHLPEVKAMVVHQLLPELAVEIAQASYVIFVDACAEESCTLRAQLSPITARLKNASSRSLTHRHSAQGLLALTQKVYGHVPQAWLLQVPTKNFDFGEQLSSTAHRGIDDAVQTIERLLLNYQVPYPATLEPCIKSA